MNGQFTCSIDVFSKNLKFVDFKNIQDKITTIDTRYKKNECYFKVIEFHPVQVHIVKKKGRK